MSVVKPANIAEQVEKHQSARLKYAVVFEQDAPAIGIQVQRICKRILDAGLASMGFMVVSPLLLIIAVMIKISSPGPVIYKSLRIGRNFQSFYMYKFRTMRPDADALRDELRKQANLQGELFKLDHDPRVTKIGQFLRATSLDELPQLINVIRGDMSLVGPRPLPPDESQLFEPPYTVRFQVFPGITGLWQVSGRSNLSFEQLCRLEYQYVAQWNLWEDIKILLQTIPAVLLKRGAC